MLTPEQRAADLRDVTRDALRQADIVPSPTMLDGLVARIQSSLETYQRESTERTTSREAHDALRRLFRLLGRKDPPVGQIRERVRTLPALAGEALARRARVHWPRLKGVEFSPEVFADWVANAEREELIPRLRTLVVEGGIPVESRGDDRPAKWRLEPVIMGVARGAGDNSSAGGRPPKEAEDELVMNLALDWLLATGQMPALKRGDTKGFPGLVHRIFELYDIAGAEQALRRYSTEVRGRAVSDGSRTEPS